MKKIFIIGCLLVFVASTITAQDLIKNTQLGLNNKNNNSTSNRIAQQVATAQATSKFESVSLFQLSEQNMRTAHQNYIKDQVYLELKSLSLETLFRTRSNTLTLDIPVSTRQSFQLELVKVNILAPNFEAKTINGRVLYNSDNFPGVFYRGIVKGDSNSIATLSVFKDHIRAIISDNSGNYVLAQTTSNSNKYILYNDSNLRVSNNFTCHTSSEHLLEIEEELTNIQQSRNSNTSCINIYVEADYATFQSHGSNLDNVTAFIVDLFNQTCTIYLNENINILLSGMGIWSSVDPFASLDDDLGIILPAFTQARQGFDGDLAHLISTRNMGGGLAWVDVLCRRNDGDPSDQDNAHAVTANMATTVVPFPTYSWNVSTFAHEMGHNFGSRHTHDCEWNANNDSQIDDCGNKFFYDNPQYGTPEPCYDPNNPIIPPPNGGTIMSYCHLQSLGVGINLSLGFGAQPGALITDRYNNANCTGDCTVYCVNDLSLPGDISTHLYEAFNSITSNGVIQAGQSVTYDAGGFICLNPGFIADSGNGSDFLAHIDGCNGARIASSGLAKESVMNHGKYSSTANFSSQFSTSIQNIPNPFSNHTTFDIHLTDATKVNLEIYDVTGKLVRVLLDGQTLEGGQHKINFDANQLSSGIYLYRLATEQENITKKMVLKK